MGNLTHHLRRAGVCVATGYGIKIFVQRGQLFVEDGRDRRKRVYSRATHGISRLVVIGTDGFISLEAISWLQRLGISLIHLDRAATLLASSAVAAGDARLRRLQAAAGTARRNLQDLWQPGPRQATPLLRRLSSRASARARFDLHKSALRAIKTRRDAGNDPTHRGTAAEKRAAKTRARQAEERAWEAEHEKPDPALFKTEILPAIQTTPTSELERATGLSRRYIAMIRRGE